MEHTDLFGNIISTKSSPKSKSGLTVIENGEYIFYPDFFTKSESDKYLQKLKADIEWKQESMNMYGKQVAFPRLTAWYGDNDKPYSFSGITLAPKIWTKELVDIKDSLNMICGESIMAYPPGIPIISPGEIITYEIINYINLLKDSGAYFTDAQDKKLNKILVVNDTASIS